MDEFAVHSKISMSSDDLGQCVGVWKSDGAWRSDYLGLEYRTGVHVRLQPRE